MRSLFVAFALVLLSRPSQADEEARALMSQALEAQIDGAPQAASFDELTQIDRPGRAPEAAPGSHKALAAHMAHAALEARRAAMGARTKGDAQDSAADQARSARGAAQSAAGQATSQAAKDKASHGHSRPTP